MKNYSWLLIPIATLFMISVFSVVAIAKPSLNPNAGHKGYFTITDLAVTDPDDPFLLPAPYDLRVTSYQCLVTGAGDSTSLNLNACDDVQGGCVSMSASLACTDGSRSQFSPLANTEIDQGDWLRLIYFGVTGPVDEIVVTVEWEQR